MQNSPRMCRLYPLRAKVSCSSFREPKHSPLPTQLKHAPQAVLDSSQPPFPSLHVHAPSSTSSAPVGGACIVLLRAEGAPPQQPRGDGRPLAIQALHKFLRRSEEGRQSAPVRRGPTGPEQMPVLVLEGRRRKTGRGLHQVYWKSWRLNSSRSR